MAADLHIHSTASDGQLTPADIVAKAASLGLTAISLTDHDTIDGLKEAKTAGLSYGIQVIPGIELSAQYLDLDVHILGYFIQYKQGVLRDELKKIRTSRHQRAVAILRRLRLLGMPLSWDQVRSYVTGDVVGRPHIARALVEAGYVPSVQAAFDNYLEHGCPAYVPRYKLTVQQAIDLIHSSKGAAVLAHPGLLPGLRYLGTLLKFNWQGIEVYHPDHTPKKVAILEHIAAKIGLISTGGSDFHGSNCTGSRDLGSCVVDCIVVEQLKKTCQF